MTIQRRETFIQASIAPRRIGLRPVRIRAWEELLFESIGYIGDPADIAQR
jgi:hypothetical protein